MRRKKLLTPREILKGSGLSPQQQLFLLLYIVCGYRQVEAYTIAFRPTASHKSIPPLASHLLADFRVNEIAVKLAKFSYNCGINIPTKYILEL